MTKYITKNMPMFAGGKKRYWVSDQLLRPTLTHNQRNLILASKKYTLSGEVYHSDLYTLEKYDQVFPEAMVSIQKDPE